jgi:excisionase family DNA binding protein
VGSSHEEAPRRRLVRTRDQSAVGAVGRPGVRIVGRDPNVISVPEAARLLCISKDLAYDLARRGELPGAFQLGRRWRVSLVRLNSAIHGSEDGGAQHAG